MDSIRLAMLRARLFAGSFGALILLAACEVKVPGSYELDFEETKREVSKSVQAHPDELPKQADVLKMLGDTQLSMRFDENGTFVTTTKLASRSAVTPPPRSGKWTQVGQKLTLAMDGDGHAHGDDEATSCAVDGKRLRCSNPSLDKLYANYVLIRK